MVDYTITVLDISDRELTQLPDDIDKYTNLQELNCYCNQLTSLDNLPYNLKILHCGSNNLKSLDNLPPNLQILDCNNNKLISLNYLPHNNSGKVPAHSPTLFYIPLSHK